MSDNGPSTRADDSARPAFEPVSRKAATIANLIYQYASMGLVLVRGLILPALALEMIDRNLWGAWMAAGNVLLWLMVSEGGSWLLLRQQTAIEFAKSDRAALSAVIGTGALVQCLLFLVIAILGAVLAPFSPGWFGIAGPDATAFRWAFFLTALAGAMSLLATISRAVHHGFQKQTAVNASSLAGEAASLVLTVWLLYQGQGILAFAWGLVAREIIQNFINWPLFAMLMKRHGLSPYVSRERLNYTLPLMGWTFASNVGVTLRTSVDALVVSQTLGNSSVVISEYSKKIWEILAQFVTKATNAFTPGLANLYAQGDLPRSRAVTRRLGLVVAIATSLLAGGVWAFNESFVRLWVGSENYAGASYNWLCGLATVCMILSLALNDVLFAAGNVRATAKVQLAQTLVRVVLLLATISWLGLLSIPISVLVGNLVGGLYYLVSQWRELMGYTVASALAAMRPLFVGLALAGALALAWTFVPTPTSWAWLVLQAALFAGALLALLATLEPAVRDELKTAFSGINRRLPGLPRPTSETDVA